MFKTFLKVSHVQKQLISLNELAFIVPGANLIENVLRATMKVKLHEKRVFTVKQLSYQLRKIWNVLLVTLDENLVNSILLYCQAI